MTFLPIVARELSVASRKWGTYWLRPASVLLVLVVWFFLLANTPRTERGMMLLTSTSVLAFAYALFAGALRTADCLAEEKREGTIGLLFLTDLKPYDVVLGKLVASSLNTVFILVAVLPILWLSVLVGGVTGREFFRIVLVLLTTMFFSLGVGMFASAVSREARKALTVALLAIVFVAGVLPAWWWLQHIAASSALPGKGLDLIIRPSPAFVLFKAFERNYNLWGGPRDFWISLGIVGGIGLGGIILATIILPHVWQEKGRRHERKKKEGSIQIRRQAWDGVLRRQRLAWNPMYWLAVRDSTVRRSALWTVGLLGPVFLFAAAASYFATPAHVPFIVSMFVAFALHLVVKVFVAAEASRRLNQDRKSGALELLLVTPLPIGRIVSGQRQALLRHFVVPVLLLLLVNLLLCLVVITNASRLQIRNREFGIFMELFVGGMVVLVFDFFALGWLGMWQGLKGRHHLKTVAVTLGILKGIPWLLIFLLIFSEPRAGPNEIAAIFAFLFIVAAVISLVSGLVARAKLLRRFRLMAAGR